MLSRKAVATARPTFANRRVSSVVVRASAEENTQAPLPTEAPINGVSVESTTPVAVPVAAAAAPAAPSLFEVCVCALTSSISAAIEVLQAFVPSQAVWTTKCYHNPSLAMQPIRAHTAQQCTTDAVQLACLYIVWFLQAPAAPLSFAAHVSFLDPLGAQPKHAAVYYGLTHSPRLLSFLCFCCLFCLSLQAMSFSNPVGPGEFLF